MVFLPSLMGFRCRVKVEISTRAVDVVNHLCKEHNICNPSEWAVHEVWDCLIPPGIDRRRLPPDELIVDETMMRWEQTLRVRHGAIAEPQPGAFRLELGKVSSLCPATRSKKEIMLEFYQALAEI